jgi:hypothetical protein
LKVSQHDHSRPDTAVRCRSRTPACPERLRVVHKIGVPTERRISDSDDKVSATLTTDVDPVKDYLRTQFALPNGGSGKALETRSSEWVRGDIKFLSASFGAADGPRLAAKLGARG